MQEIIDNLIRYGYIILFIYTLGGGLFAFIGAVLLSLMGRMDLEVSFVIAGAANFVGSTALYWFARTNKAEVHRYFAHHRRKLAYSHLLMKRWGVGILFMQKYLHGIKTLVPLVAGLTRYPPRLFVLYNLLASAIWAAAVGSLIVAFSAAAFAAAVWIGGHPYISPLILLTLALLLWRYLSKP